MLICDGVGDLEADARPRDGFVVDVFVVTTEDVEFLATVTGRVGAKIVSAVVGTVEAAAFDFGRETLLLLADVGLAVDAEIAATADLLKFPDDVVGVLRIRFAGGGHAESFGIEEPLFVAATLVGDVKSGFAVSVGGFDVDDEAVALEEWAVVLVALIGSSSSKTVKATSIIS